MTRRLAPGDIIFVAAALLIAAGHVVAAWQSLAGARLWEDEAFNLTVPVNLLAGHGYASDGALSGSAITPWDTRISTGPIVLLPIAGMLAAGADLVIGARLVPLIFFAALLAALWILGRRIGGRWAALVAVSVPLAFDATGTVSPIQGPADVLGEIPAAALIAWALIAVRRRPWLAGLLLGCAIQAKYIAFLAAPALVVALLLAQHGVPWLRRLRSLILPVICTGIPTLIVEIGIFLSLGRSGYLGHLRSTKEFLLDGGQVDARTTVVEKLATLVDAWRLPGVATLALVLIAIAVGILAVWRLAPPERRALWRDERMPLLAGALVGLAAYVGWWSTAAHTPLWPRHPAPGVLAFAPVLAAFAVLAIRSLAARAPAGAADPIRTPAGERGAEGASPRRAAAEHRPGPGDAVTRPAGGPGAGGAASADPPRRPALRALGVGAAAVLAIAVAAQTGLAATTALRAPNELAQQREIASAVSELDAPQIATAWSPTISIVVLAGSHLALYDAPPENIEGAPLLMWNDRANNGDISCTGAVLLEIENVTVCAAE